MVMKLLRWWKNYPKAISVSPKVRFILHCTSFWETNTSQTEKYRSARDVREYIIISKRQAKNIWKNCSQNIIRIPPVSARFWPVILSTRINSNYIKRSKTPISFMRIGVFIFICNNRKFLYFSSLFLNSLLNSIYCFRCSMRGTSDLN